MSDPYQEEVKLSPNKGGTITPKFIVLHHTAGNFAGSVSWCLNASAKVSYHYIINPENGNRVQLVWDSKRAWHAGKSSWGGYSGLNGYSIGIAFDRNTNTRTPAECEIDSAGYKCVYLMDKFGIGKEEIVTHAMISPGRKDDVSDETYELVKARVDELI